MGAKEHPGWLPSRLREARDAYGLTLDEVASRIRNLGDVGFRPPAATFQQVGRHERGEVYPGRYYRRAYCHIFDRDEPSLGFRDRRPWEADRSGRAAAGSRNPLPAGYPPTFGEGAAGLAALWHADLTEVAAVVSADADPGGWNDAVLGWILRSTASPRPSAAAGAQVGAHEVEALRATTAMFTELDFRFGGHHARRALIQFLATDAEQLLSGSCTDATGRELRAAVGEACLLTAWMTYDAGLQGLAQRYFVQALHLAQVADDRMLAGGVLAAMSHQATYLGRGHEAANLARSAAMATMGAATPTLTAQFLAMEARGHASSGDAAACHAALSAAERAFDHGGTSDDPDWVSYFDEAELYAEFAHCHLDLARSHDAVEWASRSLALASGQAPRSDYFVIMVAAKAHLDQGQPDAACRLASEAIPLADQFKSARSARYLAEFRARLQAFKRSPVVRAFADQATSHPSWNALASEG